MASGQRTPFQIPTRIAFLDFYLIFNNAELFAPKPPVQKCKLEILNSQRAEFRISSFRFRISSFLFRLALAHPATSEACQAHQTGAQQGQGCGLGGDATWRNRHVVH